MNNNLRHLAPNAHGDSSTDSVCPSRTGLAVGDSQNSNQAAGKSNSGTFAAVPLSTHRSCDIGDSHIDGGENTHKSNKKPKQWALFFLSPSFFFFPSNAFFLSWSYKGLIYRSMWSIRIPLPTNELKTFKTPSPTPQHEIRHTIYPAAQVPMEHAAIFAYLLQTPEEDPWTPLVYHAKAFSKASSQWIIISQAWAVTSNMLLLTALPCFP